MRLAFSFMRAGLWEYRSGEGVVFGCLVGWLCFSPVASRVSARQPSYFFLLRQKKVTKKKASHVRAASRCLALLERWNTPEAASPPPPQGGDTSGPAKPVPRCPWQGLRFACRIEATHFSTLTSRKGTARRATTTDPLIPHPSLLIMGNHKGCPYTLPPHSSLLRPHSSLLTPPSSLLTPHSSLLTPHSSLLTPHSSLL